MKLEGMVEVYMKKREEDGYYEPLLMVHESLCYSANAYFKPLNEAVDDYNAAVDDQDEDGDYRSKPSRYLFGSRFDLDWGVRHPEPKMYWRYLSLPSMRLFISNQTQLDGVASTIHHTACTFLKPIHEKWLRSFVSTSQVLYEDLNGKYQAVRVL
jgi:hypothetical protein